MTTKTYIFYAISHYITLNTPDLTVMVGSQACAVQLWKLRQYKLFHHLVVILNIPFIGHAKLSSQSTA